MIASIAASLLGRPGAVEKGVYAWVRGRWFISARETQGRIQVLAIALVD